MEISQTALAVMLASAVPIGIVLSIAYRVTDFGWQSRKNAIIVVLQNIKDFLFMAVAAVMIVILVYYQNQGQFRYLAPVGVLGGYWLTDKLLSRTILKMRGWIWRTVCAVVTWSFGILFAPVMAIWRATLGKRVEQASHRAIIKRTENRASWWTAQASFGFENVTEAKEWKKKKNNRMRS